MVSGAFALRSIIAAVAVVPIGYWSDRYGPRLILIISFVLTGIGMVLTPEATSLAQFYLTQGVIMGLATAAPMACISGTVGKWHGERRALALGIVSVGSGLSAVFLPPLVTALIQAYSWQVSMGVLGLFVLLAGVLGSLCMKNPPHVAGPEAVKNAPQTKPEKRGLFHAWRVLPRFLKWHSFLPIFIMFFLFNTSTWVVLAHLVNYLTDKGLAPLLAASMFSAMGLGSIAGRLATGFLGQRLGSRLDAVLCFSLMACSSLLIILGTGSIVLLWVSVMAFGAGYGGSAPLATALLAERFGVKHLSMLTGMTFFGIYGGSGLGPWLAGAIFDVSGGYTWALIMAAAFATTAAILALSLRPALPAVREKVEELVR